MRFLRDQLLHAKKLLTVIQYKKQVNTLRKKLHFHSQEQQHTPQQHEDLLLKHFKGKHPDAWQQEYNAHMKVALTKLFPAMIITFFLLFSVFFYLGQGITGMVVQESDVLILGASQSIETLQTENAIYSAYDTPIRIVSERKTPVGYTGRYYVTNTKNLSTGYIAATPGVSITAERPIREIAITNDFVGDWNDAVGILGTIRREITSTGLPSDLETMFPVQVLPGPGKEIRLYAYAHAEGETVGFDISGPQSGLVLFIDPASAWWNVTWDRKKEINVTHSGTETLIDFPIYINLTKEPEMQVDYDDIRFINGNCSSNSAEELDYEIEYFDTIRADVWVRYPSFEPGNNSLCLYYGNDAATSGENASGVWSAGYEAVHHLQEAPLDNGVHNDSANSNDGVWQDDNGLGDSNITFIVDGANQFDGTDDYIDLGAGPSPATTGSFTWEAWISTTVGSQNTIIAANTDTFGNNLMLFIRNDVLSLFDGGFNDADTTITTGSIFHVAAVLNDSNNLIQYYVNGVQEPTTHTTTTRVNSDDVYSIGQEYDGASRSDFFQGTMDEVRISSVARTADWMQQTYEVIRNQDSVVTFGPSENVLITNISIDEPTNGTRVTRLSPFIINGTYECVLGDCENVTAYAQFFSSISPINTWLETTFADFNSFNTSTNISARQDGTLSLDTTVNWWDVNYNYRRELNITVGNTTPLNGYENYTVELILNTTGSEFLASGDDIRIVFFNGTFTELDRQVISPDSDSTRVRFALMTNLTQNESTTNYSVYYGNSAATNPPDDLEAVYLWYDDASSNRLSEYTLGRVDDSCLGGGYGGSPVYSVSGYYVFDTGDNQCDSLRPTTISERDVYVEFELRQTGAYPNDMHTGPITRAVTSGLPGNEVTSSLYYYAMAFSAFESNAYDEHDDIMALDRTTRVVENGTLGEFPANAWTRLGLASWGINPTGLAAYYDATPLLNETGGFGAAPRFTGTHGADYESSGQVGIWAQQDIGQIRNMLVRRYIDPEPTIVLGVEESPEYVSSGTYISSSFDTQIEGTEFFEILWNAITPTNTTVSVDARTSPDNSSWGAWLPEVNNTLLDAAANRYVQYRLQFESTNVSLTPLFNDMQIRYQLSTEGFESMGSGKGFVATNPVNCGTLSDENCTLSWSATPTQVGVYELRILANATNPDELISENRTVEVYATSFFLLPTISPEIEARGNNITVSGTLVDDVAEPLVGYNISFFDETDGILYGSALTDSSGEFTINYTIPNNASLGLHTVNISFAGNDSEFLQGVSADRTYTVSSTPNVTAEFADPGLIGFGQTVRITANATDDVGIDRVWANITGPDLVENKYFMTLVSGDEYELSFTDTWEVGTYTIKISANNTDGIEFDPPTNFTVNASVDIFADAEFDEYQNFQTVFLDPRKRDDWWNNSWLYRSELLVEGTTSALTEYQVDLTLDTQSLISQGKLQNACQDLRFISNKAVYELPINITNTLGQDMTDYVVRIPITDASILGKISASGDDLRIFENQQISPYTTSSTIPFWFEPGNSEATVWIELSLPSGNTTTIYVYYGDTSFGSESNYSAIFSTVIGEVNNTAAGSTPVTTNFSVSFNQTPVVVSTIITTNDAGQAATRIDNVSTLGFDVFSEESTTLDGIHASETISYIALEPGTWYLGSAVLEVGTTSFDNPSGSTFNVITYGTTYEEAPGFFSQLQTINEVDPAHMRCQSVDAASASCKIEETAGDTAHATETIGYFSIPDGDYTTTTGALSIGGVLASDTPVSVSIVGLTNPVFVAKLDTEAGGDNTHERATLQAITVDVFSEEEAIHDGPHADENISYVLAEAGSILATPFVTNPETTIGTERVALVTDSELDYYVVSGCNTTNTSIMVQTASIPANDNTTFFYYYGNPSATSNSDLTETLQYESPQTIGYVVDNNIVTGSLTLFSLSDNNSVTVGDTSSAINRFDSVTVSTPSLGTPVRTTKHVQAEGTGNADIINPATWAGTNFIYNWRRGSDDFSFLSPWGTANVSIYDDGTLVDNFLVDDSGTFVGDTYDIGNGNVMQITSDIPILVSHAQNNQDIAPLYPATNEFLYGVPSGNARTAAGPNGTTFDYYLSSGTSGVGVSLAAWAVSTLGGQGGGGGADGAAPAMRINSNGTQWPIGVIQQADGDGSETTVFLPERQLGNVFGSSLETEHLAIAALTPGTNCTVFNSTGGVVDSQLSTGNENISKIGFSTGNDAVFTSPNWIVECNDTVYAMIDDNDPADGNERHLMSIRDMRQFYYPEPTITPVTNTEETAISGLYNVGETNITGFLYLAVQTNASGSWQIITPPVFQDITVRTITSGAIVNISDVWSDAGGWSTDSRDPGFYRTYVALRDNESNVLIDGRGLQILDTFTFRIIQALIQITNLTHENNATYVINEYEAGDTIEFVNITVRAVNNTAIDATVDLTLENESGVYPGWGPDSQLSCGNIAPDATCTVNWTNSSAGYLIPPSILSGNYDFVWSINASADNADSVIDNSFDITVHNLPSTFGSQIDPSRIFAGDTNGTFNFTFSNLWSQDIEQANITLNCPAGVGLICECEGESDATCSFSSLPNGSYTINYTTSANTTATPGDYPLNITIEYLNPGQEVRTWTEQVTQTLEVRLQGVLAITVLNQTLNITRGESGFVDAFINNTGLTTSTGVTFNYTLPSGWSNTTPLVEENASFGPGNILWNNLTFDTTIGVALGPQSVVLNSGSGQGQEDFKVLSMTVFANTQMINVTVNDTNASRGETILVQATLLYDDGTPISGVPVLFTDSTDNVSIGSDTTNAQGLAERTYTLPSNASLGNHIFNASYAGSDVLYLNPSSNETTIDIGELPVINSAFGNPIIQGLGQNVTLTANVTDDDAIASVSATVTYPNGSQVIVPLVFSAGLYTALFSQTWDNGTYALSIQATDATGSTTTQSGSPFQILFGGFLNITTRNNTYGQNEQVNLTEHTGGWWFDQEWLYKQRVSYAEQDNISYSEVLLNFTFDTATLIAESKLQADCGDLRLLNAQGQVLEHTIENCDDTQTTIYFYTALGANTTLAVNVFYGSSSIQEGLNLSAENFWRGKAYVVSDTQAAETVDVAARYNDTQVCLYNATGSPDCVTLDQGQIFSWSADKITQESYIEANKTVSTAFANADDGSTMVPLGFAGKQFVYNAPRDSESLDFYSPWGEANILVYDSTDILRGNITVGVNQTGEVDFDFPDNTAFMVESNISVLAHFETVSNDYHPMIPLTNELWGILGATDTLDHVACFTDDTLLQVYFDNGTNYNVTCNRGESVNFGAGGSQGNSIGVYVLANRTAISGMFSADGDGTEGVIWLPEQFLDTEYVVPQDAEYISVVPIQPSTFCELISPINVQLDLATSTSVAPPQPQDLIYFTGTPIPQGSRVVCNASIYAYFESNDENAETGLWGQKSYPAIPNTPPSITSAPEATYESILSNTGSTTFSGLLLMTIQRNVSGGWEDYATIINDSDTSTIRTLGVGESVDIGGLWNAVSWDTGNSPAGDYRANVSFVTPTGLLISSATTPYNALSDTSEFNITPPDIALNISAITIYDVTDSLSKRVYTSELEDNGTNKTFIIEATRQYRLEVAVDVLPGDPWSINTSTITFVGFNSSWDVNAADIWYTNDTTDRDGGSWNGTVEWNSTLGGVVQSGSQAVFSFIVNLTPAIDEDLPILFTIEDPLFTISDQSLLRSLVPDTQPPRLIAPLIDFYNLTVEEVTRGGNTTVYARWDETISEAQAEFNSTSPILVNQSITLAPSNPFNWTNYTIETNALWLRGNHLVKIHAADQLNNYNSTLPYISFTVWGLAKVLTGSVSNNTPAQADVINISCQVVDETDSDSPIASFPVQFYNDTDSLGTVLTNSTGWAVLAYQDFTPGTENITCNVTRNDAQFYKTAVQNEFSTSITTTENEAPRWFNQTGPPSIVYKGTTAFLSVDWTDNFQLSATQLFTNVTGSFAQALIQSLTSTSDQANFSYVLPTSMEPGIVGWYQIGNDSSNNTNQTATALFEAWGFSEINQMLLSPSSMFLTNTTNISCQITDANSSVPIEGYVVDFFNSTSLIGTNITNATGWVDFSYQDFTAGQENIRCVIGENTTLYYNASETEQSLTLNTVNGSDALPPVTLSGTYALNDTVLLKGEPGLLSAQWNESINVSNAELNTTSASIAAELVPGPYTNNWTNFTFVTNSSWLVGQHVIRLTAEDEAGNLNNTLPFFWFNVTATSRIDWQTPTGNQDPGLLDLFCLVTEEENGQPISGYTVFFYNDTGELIGTPSTNSSGIATIAYDASAYSGSYDFSCRIFNADDLFYSIGSNFQDTESLYFDTLPPNVTLNNPINNSNESSTSITFNFTAADDNDSVLECAVTVDGIDTGINASNGVPTTTTQIIAPGIHFWNVTCIDDAGNSQTSETRVFNVTLPDADAPVITLLTPEASAWINSSVVTFTYNVTDESGILNCSLYLDGGLNTSDSSVTQGLDSFTVSGVEDGTREWFVSCIDEAFNTNSSDTLTFQVDTTTPTAFDLLTPVNPTITQVLNATLTWEETTETNFANYTVQFATSTLFDSIVATYNSFARTFTQTNASFPPNTRMYWRVLAYDLAGNSRVSTSTFEYITDYAAPTVGLVSPGPDAYPGTNVTFSFLVQDETNSTCSIYTNSTGAWLSNMSLANLASGSHSITINNFPVNASILWNVECVDAFVQTAFAPGNRTFFTGPLPPGDDNQTIPVNLTVNNSAPVIDQVVFESPINLVAATTTSVVCQANVSDFNGVADIQVVNMTLHAPGASAGDLDDNNTHYSNSSCACAGINDTTTACSCSFALLYHTNPGLWTCTANAFDTNGEIGIGADTGTVNTLLALFVNQTVIDYGDLDTNDVSSEENVSVINYGNTIIDVSLFSYAQAIGDSLAMNCTNGDILAGQQRFSTVPGLSFPTMIALSGNPAGRSLADLSIAKPTDFTNQTNSTYWRLQVPPGVQGECTGLVVFQAEANT